MAYGAAALGRTAEGQVVFVDDALPGEAVVAEVGNRKRRFLTSRAIEVTRRAAGRVEPPCPYVPECGGCQWQHASYEAQVGLKARVFAETLRRAGVDVPSPEVVACAEPLRYRIRGEFHVVPPKAGHGHRLGFNRRRSWDLVPVEDCLIHHPHITEALPGICRALDACPPGTARSIRLTTTPQRRELLWRALGGPAPEGLQEALTAELDGWLVHQDSLTLEFEGALIDGRPDNPIFRVDSDTFIQVNHHQAHLLYGRALAYLGDRPGRLLEGYAGFGAMSLLAATRPDPAARPLAATLVEENRRALLLARLHVRLHGAEGFDVAAGTVEEVLPRLEPGEADSVILDPPRAGCAPSIPPELARLGPGRIVYVSCDPATLGRDLRRLVDQGFRVEKQALVDMFPQTYHVESVTLLGR